MSKGVSTKFLITVLVLASSSSLFLIPARAASMTEDPRFSDLLVAIYNVLMPIGILLSVFMIISNAYQLMTSQGVPAKVADAQGGLTSAVIGAIFILTGISILKIIMQTTFGVSF